MLFQLRKISFAIINSSTILLPAWRKLTTKHQLPERLMPRDVRTRWNSTFTMLSFAVKYKAVIDDITDDRTMQLRDYELSEKEWDIAQQLSTMLKVCKLTLRAATVLNSYRLCRFSTTPLSSSHARPLVLLM